MDYWTNFLWISKFFVLLSSAGFFLWFSTEPTVQYDTVQTNTFYSYFQHFVTRFRNKLWKQRAAGSVPVMTYFTSCRRKNAADDFRRKKNEETNNHERSTWRLRTPTICRRSVPALCNAGLPKKKTLQRGNINRKTSQIVLVSTMP